MVGGLGTTAVGTPEQVADEFERWVEEGGVDGFNIVSIFHSQPVPSTNRLGRHMLSHQAPSMM